LIFGAIFVRKVGEYCQKEGFNINYPIVGAAGYAGSMTWHGGLSGSAPLIVAQEGHFLEAQMGILSIDHTLLSFMNLVICHLLLFVIPAFFFWYGKRSQATTLPDLLLKSEKTESPEDTGSFIDHQKWPGMILGSLIVLLCLYKPFTNEYFGKFTFINLNYINFLIFGTGLVLHGSFHAFTRAVEHAIGDIAGIVVQFPLYAGIMGIMKYSGLIAVFSDLIVSHSSAFTFPVFTFFSAALVNTFVPSGGGQWAVQGPIIIEAAKNLHVDFGKAIMALAYGDELTNMLQPFWALPLLGITRLKAGQLLPHTIKILFIGLLIFITGLMLWP
jgi:short-chain fatty acids transporter